MTKEDIQMERNPVDIGNDVPGTPQIEQKSPKYQISPQIQAGIRKLCTDCQRDLVPNGMA
jgi:hypothetical protein